MVRGLSLMLIPEPTPGKSARRAMDVRQVRPLISPGYDEGVTEERMRRRWVGRFLKAIEQLRNGRTQRDQGATDPGPQAVQDARVRPLSLDGFLRVKLAVASGEKWDL